ncbi:MAG TPA: RDD family protein [Acidimicrobiia bacterium]|nr:RDD family protein [Acidimicrobiia bacterium]
MTFHDSARLDLVTYEDRISIPTPEGVELELVLAGVGSRLVATVIDYLVKGAILLALWIIGTAVGGDEVGGFLLAGLVVASFLVWFGYDVAFETLASGRTPGKRAAGLRVVRLGGEPVGFLASAVRNLLRLVDSLPGLYAVGALSVLFSRRNQRLGDLAAGTLVVRERRAPLPVTRPFGPDFAVADRYAAWDVSGVTSFELVTVRRFLERRWQLDPAARGRLGWELAERLRPKVAGAPADLHPEHFLEALAEAKAARG